MLNKNKTVSQHKITTILDVLYIKCKGFDHSSPAWDNKAKNNLATRKLF